jgi:outer membrane protein TolC
VAVLEAQQMLQTTQSNLHSLEEHLKNAEQLYSKDMAPYADVLAAHSAAAEARQRCRQAENELLLAKAEYNHRLGRPGTARVWLQEPVLESEEFDLQTLLTSAVAKRVELDQMVIEAEALRQKAGAIDAMNRPQVYLGGTYQFEENRYREPDGIGSLGVAALWNIYDGHHDTYKGNALLYEAAAIERRRSALAREVELEIQRSWLQRAELTRQIEESANHVRLSEENSNNVRQRYQVGMATNAEVLAAEAAKSQSLERLHRVRYAAILAEMKMRRAAGIL